MTSSNWRLWQLHWLLCVLLLLLLLLLLLWLCWLLTVGKWRKGRGVCVSGGLVTLQLGEIPGVPFKVKAGIGGPVARTLAPITITNTN